MRLPVLLLLILVVAVAPDLVVPACQAVLEAAMVVIGELLDGDSAAVVPGVAP